MTYNPNVPQPTDIPSQSQGQFLINFQQLNTIFASNHFEYNFATAADRGKHRQVTYVRSGADPALVGTNVITYTKASPIAGVSAPYIRMPSGIYSQSIVINMPDVIGGPGTFNLFDFAGQPAMMGLLFCIDSGTQSRTLFCQFTFDGVQLHIPGAAAQIASGSITSFTHVGSMLQVTTSAFINAVRTKAIGIIV